MHDLKLSGTIELLVKGSSLGLFSNGVAPSRASQSPRHSRCDASAAERDFADMKQRILPEAVGQIRNLGSKFNASRGGD